LKPALLFNRKERKERKEKTLTTKNTKATKKIAVILREAKRSRRIHAVASSLGKRSAVGNQSHAEARSCGEERRHCERSEAIQKRGASKKHWIASSLSLLAMTPIFSLCSLRSLRLNNVFGFPDGASLIRAARWDSRHASLAAIALSV
jgi:hypothetical protein